MTPQQYAEKIAKKIIFWPNSEAKIIPIIEQAYTDGQQSTINTKMRVDYAAGFSDGCNKGISADKWVNVKDILPDPLHPVLALDVIQYEISWVNSTGEWARDINGDTFTPTHWMPLPAPPTT